MNASPVRSITSRTDLLDAFKRYGLVMIAVPAVVVAVLVGWFVQDTIVREFGVVFAQGMAGVVVEDFGVETFVAGERNEAFDTFDSHIRERVAGGRLIAARVQDTGGAVVYSTNPDEIGTVIPFEDQQRDAIESGEAFSRVVSADSLLKQDSERVLRVVGPVRFGSAGSPDGVITALKPFSAVYPSIRSSVLTVAITILAGAAVAYLLLHLLMVRTGNEIAKSRQQVERLNARLGQSLSEMERHLIGTLQALNSAVDAKDRYTALHSLNVADYACALGLKLGLDNDIRLLERAGLLHDVGKIGISEAILEKPSGLSAEEYEIVKDHSRIGATMIETLPFLREIVPAVTHHHERWDGTGYPAGLSGADIPVLARVLAIADAFDAMTTSRPYRPAITVAAAKAELMEGRGTQFDPELVDAFIELVDDGAIVVRDMRVSA